MTRDIKFRGKRVDNGEWIYGDLWQNKGKYIAPFATGELVMVIPKSVSQFTGLYDKNGKEIYEGDIIRDTDTGNIRQVIYNAPSFVLVDIDRYFYWHYHADEYEVIGTIHDNPSLLEVQP